MTYAAKSDAVEEPSQRASGPDRTHFKLRVPLLDEGRSNHTMATTDNMWATVKVYASGGENGLHTHSHEDHCFVVLQGSARYYDADGGHIDVVKNEGIMLPAGAYYYFHATSEEPLVLLRVGCRARPGEPSDRLNIRGEPMPGDAKENKQGVMKIRAGAFFE